MIRQSVRMLFLTAREERYQFIMPFFLLLTFVFHLVLAGGFFSDAQAQTDTCGWATVKKWKVKMHLTQILDRTGPFAQGSTCNYDYTLALNHVSDVTGEFSSTGSGGTYQGSLTSQEVVNNHLDLPAYGDPNCPLGSVYFSEVCTGEGSESEVALTIDPAMGKYTVSFPHTGIDCTFQYIAAYGSFETTLRKEINGTFIIAYPGQQGRILAESPSDPVTTLEFDLPSGSPRTITGETTFPHSQYPEIPVTWSWELTPDMGEAESELGSPDGKNKAAGGASAPGAGYGVPIWTVNMANLNIFITDTPLWYRSPIGPPVEVTLSYNSKSAGARFEPIGRKWQLNYESYLSADEITSDVTIIMPDGRRDVYTYTPTGFTPPYRVFNELKVTREGGFMEGSDYELTFPDGTVYVYKVPTGSLLWAFLTEIRDPHGNRLSLEWEGQSPWGGRLKKITDAMSRITYFFPDANDRIGSIRDPFGRTARFQYDDQSNLTKITDMGGYSTNFTYDGCGNLQSMVQGSNTWYFETDATGLTVRDNMGSERFELDALQGRASYRGANAAAGATYNYTQAAAQDGGKNKDVTGIQTPEAVSFEYTYDAKGNLLTDTLKAVTGDETAHFTYNAKGKVTSVRDARGAVTLLTYYANNVDLFKLEDGLGSITATYNTKHDITSLTDRLGNTKFFFYNNFGQLTQTIQPVDGRDIQTDFIYNADHQIIRIERAGAVVASYGYDNIGRVNAYTDANGYTRRYTYNDLDDLLSISYPDDSAIVFTPSPTVPHLLDSMTDQAGRTTTYTYNAHRQLQEINDLGRGGGRTLFVYYPAGTLKELIDPNGNSTFFEYNNDGQLTKKLFADGSSNLFFYANGRLLWSKNAREITTTYTYDKNGNLLTINYSDATPNVTITYDAYNRPIEIHDGLGVHHKAYDAASRPTTVDGPWENDTLTFGYDVLGRKTSVAVEKGPTASYSYDDLDRLTAVAGNGLAYTYSYQSGTKLLEEIERSDGSRTEYAYDAVMKRLQRLTNRYRTGGVLNEYTFTFDALGQPTSETVTNGPTLQFADITAAAYTYNTLNQAVTLEGSGALFSYDADGNMTKGFTGDGRSFEAAYDAENRPVSIQYTDAAGILRRQEYHYGSDGFLGIQKNYADGVLTAEKRFIRSGGRVLQERNSANNVERDYLWGMAQAGGVGALLALVQGGQTYQYYSNPRGDITAVLDSTGAIAAAYAYDPFGVPLATTGTLQQPMRFSTKAYDEGTGLYYYGYRFFSPQMGRWVSRDPLSEKASVNLYAFSGANPITHFDPFGAVDWSHMGTVTPEQKAYYEKQLAGIKAKDEARDNEYKISNTVSGVFKSITEGVVNGFRWIGEKLKENPSAKEIVVDNAVDKVFESTKVTKYGKEIYEAANDLQTLKAAYNDRDPASGLKMMKVGAKRLSAIPGVGWSVGYTTTKALEQTENYAVEPLRGRGQHIDEQAPSR